MGRHTAAGDDEADDTPVAAPAATRPKPGRHARPEDLEPEDVEPAQEVGRGNQSTAADLALLRERPDVRNRVIASIVVPFVLYSAVMVLIGAASVYLIWIWIPLVTAGVLAGSMLDSAHRSPDH